MVSVVGAALLEAPQNAPHLLLPLAAIRRLKVVQRARLEAVQALAADRAKLVVVQAAAQDLKVATHPVRLNNGVSRAYGQAVRGHRTACSFAAY